MLSTNFIPLGSGLEEAVKQADERRGARPKLANKIMVVFTDGWVNDGPDPEGPARRAAAAGFRVLSVGIDVSYRHQIIAIDRCMW